MSAEDVKRQLQFEREAEVGNKSMARWTNCGHYYEAEVEIEAINAKSFRVRITRARDGYPVGHKLNIPNFLNVDRWTWNNRLAPMVRVRCFKCGWEGTQSECGFGHDDFYCPVCCVESLKEIDPYQEYLEAGVMPGNLEPEGDICPECGEDRPDDERVRAGMKCGFCAY